MEKKSRLYIGTSHGRSEIEIAGNQLEIMFNLVALTNQVCKKLDINPSMLGIMLPSLISDFKRTIQRSTDVDLAAIMNQEEQL